MTKICILGNCQAQHLEAMLATALKGVEVLRLEPVFMMSDAHHDPVYAKLAEADFVFAQRISGEFKMDWLSSAAIRKTFGSKVVVWPNVYFDGYFPGVNYIYLGKWGKLLSPLLEYHFNQIQSAHKAGKSVAEAIDAFAGDGIFAATPDPFGLSLDQLKAREGDVDIVISDFIAENTAHKRFFYTPNHPTNELLGEVLRRLTGQIGLQVDVAAGVAMPYRLDEVYIAASPAVVRHYNLGFDALASYRGKEIAAIDDETVTLGGARDYSVQSLVEEFFRLYDRVFAKS